MIVDRISRCLAYLSCLLLLVVMVAGCMTDLTRGRDYGEPPICEVHAAVMAKQKVPVISGYDLYGPPWAVAMHELFPHCDSPHRWDGDIAVYGEWALDYVCPECNKARDAWFVQQRPDIARAKGIIK